MKTLKIENSDRSGTLRSLVKKTIANCYSISAKRNSFFITNIPEDISVQADENIFESLLLETLSLMASCGKDTSIKVSAEANNRTLLISITDNNTFNSYAIASKIPSLLQLARLIKGNISISGLSKKETTLSLVFTNTVAAEIGHRDYFVMFNSINVNIA